MGFFSPTAGETPSGRRPLYPDNPVDPGAPGKAWSI
jgi:hypothetical protein